MNVKLILYAISLMCSIFAVSGINFDGFIKKNHVWEARFLSIIFIFGLSFLMTNFFYDFIELLK